MSKAAELSGAALDWAVAKAEGHIDDYNSWLYEASVEEVRDSDAWHPSVKWAQGGPIIEREHIQLECNATFAAKEIAWVATRRTALQARDNVAFGATPLIAAMRCYVASRLGDEIALPQVLA